MPERSRSFVVDSVSGIGSVFAAGSWPMPPARSQPVELTEKGAAPAGSSACSTFSDHVASTQSTSPSIPSAAVLVHEPLSLSPSCADIRTGRTLSSVFVKVITRASFGVAARSLMRSARGTRGADRDVGRLAAVRACRSRRRARTGSGRRRRVSASMSVSPRPATLSANGAMPSTRCEIGSEKVTSIASIVPFGTLPPAGVERSAVLAATTIGGALSSGV